MFRNLLIAGVAATSAILPLFVPAYGNSLYDSAVVYYPFETLGAAGEVTDANANNVHLVASGGAASLVNGVDGNGIRLPDGVVLTTTATGSDDSVLNVTRDTPFTIASWVKLENATDRFYLASKYRRDTGGPLELRGWSFGVDNAGVLDAIFRLDQALGVDGRIQIRTTTSIADTNWHHVAMTFAYDETDETRGMRLYIDGVLQPMTALATGLAGVNDIDLSHDWPFVLSGRYDVQLNEGGSADDLAIWKTVLTPQQIASLLPSSTLTGDFNGDGRVDAADFVVWRKNDRTPQGYSDWRANFGNTLATISAQSGLAVVPEPSFVVLVAFVVMASTVLRFAPRSLVTALIEGGRS